MNSLIWWRFITVMIISFYAYNEISSIGWPNCKVADKYTARYRWWKFITLMNKSKSPWQQCNLHFKSQLQTLAPNWTSKFNFKCSTSITNFSFNLQLQSSISNLNFQLQTHRHTSPSNCNFKLYINSQAILSSLLNIVGF